MVHALIVDDNRDNLAVLEQLLQLEGVTVTAIDKSPALPQAIKQLSSVDIIFLDLEMPGLDGFGALEMLHREIGEDVPIVAYSVHASEIARARKSGFHSFLCKPLDPDLFGGQLARILRNEHVWAQA